MQGARRGVLPVMVLPDIFFIIFMCLLRVKSTTICTKQMRNDLYCSAACIYAGSMYTGIAIAEWTMPACGM